MRKCFCERIHFEVPGDRATSLRHIKVHSSILTHTDMQATLLAYICMNKKTAVLPASLLRRSSRKILHTFNSSPFNSMPHDSVSLRSSQLLTHMVHVHSYYKLCFLLSTVLQIQQHLLPEEPLNF